MTSDDESIEPVITVDAAELKPPQELVEKPPEELAVINTLTVGDVLNSICMPNHPLVTMGIVTLIVFGICAMTLGWQVADSLPLFLPIFLFQAMAASLFVPINALIIYNKNKERFTDQDIRISQAGIYSKTKTQASSLVAWSNVVSLKRKKGAIMIQVSKAPAIYFWIKRKSFDSDEAYDEFYNGAQAFWQAAQLDVPGQLKVYNAASLAADEHLADHHVVDSSLTFKELLTGNMTKKGPLIGLAAVLTCMLGLTCINLDYSSVGLGAFLIAFTAFLAALVPLQSWVSYRRHPEWMVGTIAISPDELISKGGGFDGKIPWTTIRKVERRHKLIFVHLKSHWSIYIPDRCFTSPVDAEIFYDDAKRYCEAANLALPRGK